MKAMTNADIAILLRKVAAAYLIRNANRFRIIAYERAADSIEHATRDLQDIWEDGKLTDIPGVGSGIAEYLDELFRTGRVKHFDEELGKVPEAIFPLLLVPGLGPKKAYKLVHELKLKSAKSVIADLEKAAKDGRIAPMEGFGEKSEQVILSAIATYKKGAIKENRMVLPVADAIAQDVLSHLRRHPAVKRADVLGSLRRQVATIGDVDVAAATDKPKEVVEHFLKYPHIKLIDRGSGGATFLVASGRQVDMRVQKPDGYGAMLQYFTGGKNHNIHLREYALARGLSLSEHGIKSTKTGKLTTYKDEESFYKALNLPWIPPELREDMGEIEAAQKDKLPKLVEVGDIKGDLHMHANFKFDASHDLGRSPLSVHLDNAVALGYDYIGISDHNPSAGKHTVGEIVQIMKERHAYYTKSHAAWQKKAKKQVGLFIMCEVDISPSGELALPKEAFDWVDAVVVSIHAAFTQPRKEATRRVIKAFETHKKVRVFGHPTARLLGKRDGVDLEWQEIFGVCKERNIALEINSFPDRLDLPDTVVFDAVKAGIKMCIDTDSHEASQMGNMKYGVAVARRGWATKDDIVNTLEYNKFKEWIL
jgi:DNA polymerase (family 10)